MTITRDSRRVSKQSAWVVVDQAVSSASTFAITFAVGRSLGPVDLGRFSLIFAVWLIVFGVFKAIIEDPLAIFGEEYGHPGAYVSASLQAAGLSLVVLVGAGTALVAFRGPGASVVALGLAVPALLIQDLWRRVAFLRARPRAAMLNDSLVLVVQLGAFAAFATLSTFSLSRAIVSWGAGATAGAVLGYFQFRPRVASVRRGLSFVGAGRHVSAWLVLDFLVNRWLRQAVLFIIAATLGKSALGGIQASANLLGFTNIIVLGASSAALAQGANALRSSGEPAMRRVVSVNVGLLTVAVGLICALYAGRSGWILRHVYGAKFGTYADLGPLVALQTFVSCLETFPVTELRLLRRTKRLFLFRAVLAPLGVVGALVLCLTFGARGGAAGTAVVAASLTIGAWLALVQRGGAGRRRRRSFGQVLVPDPE